jgi:hypothetical protein
MALTKEGCAMPKKSKKYVVRLTDAEARTAPADRRQIQRQFAESAPGAGAAES